LTASENLGAALRTLAGCRDDGERRDALAALPMEAVLFLAVTGTPGERTEVDSPLVLVLDAIRDTLDGWRRAPSGSTAFASVPFGDLDRLGWRVRTAIELARRTGQGREKEGTP
jgi:hypothetical protein